MFRITSAILACATLHLSLMQPRGFADTGAPATGTGCNCEQYLTLPAVPTLALDAAKFGLAAAHSEAAPFYRSPERVAADSLALALDDFGKYIPEECRGVAWRYSVRLQALLTNGDNGFHMHSLAGRELLYDFEGLGEGPSPELDKLSTIFNSSINMPNEKAYWSYLSRYKGLLSTQEVLSLGAAFGRLAWAGYDTSRGSNLLTPGVVSNWSIVKTMDHNAKEQYFGEANQDPTAAREAGVCRDIASAQCSFVAALGARHTVVLTWATRTGLHSTCAFMGVDPADRDVYKFNYGVAEWSHGQEGGLALFQGTADATPTYLQALPGGRTVAITSSELEKTMAMAAGANIHELDPMMIPRGFLVAANAQHGATDARVFAAQDGTGARYAGFGFDHGVWQSSHAPLTLRASVAVQNRPENDFGSYGNDNAAILYLQADQRFRTSDIPLAHNLSARLEGLATLIGTGAFSINNSAPDPAPAGTDGSFGYGFDTRLNGGVRVNQGDPNGSSKVATSYFAGVQAYPWGASDIRNAEVLPIPVLNHVLFAANGRFRAFTTPKGDAAHLLASAIVMADYYGVRARGEIGLELGNVLVSAAAQGRVNEDMPPYKEGVTRRAEVNVVYEPTPGIRAGAQGFLTLENSDATPNYAGVLGNVSITTNR